MHDSPEEALLDSRLRVMQIIVGALVMGVVTFMAIATFLDFSNKASGVTLTLVSLAFAALMLVAHFIVPNLLIGAMPRRPDPEGRFTEIVQESPSDASAEFNKLLGLYQTRLIVGEAMLEGASFLCIIAFILEGSWLPFAAVLVLVTVMISKFPTRDSVRQWIDERRDAERRERFEA